MNKIEIIAHRGASAVCPENTMIAFERALELGATGIETDVQMSADGRLVLIHDETLQRTAGSEGWVKDFTYDTLRTLDAGSWFHADFAGEPIPSLEMLFNLVQGKRILLNVELKNGIVPYKGMEEKIIQVIREWNMEQQVVLSSFNHASLVKCKRIAPDIRTALLYMEKLYRPYDYAAKLEASGLHPYKLAVAKEEVTAALAQGIVTYPFTVNDPGDMELMMDMGVQGIITDLPDVLASLMTARTRSANIGIK
ncbi:glycerophosphoryl diester phosphodiesterase [Paenibacillus polysaccharolyticus]|uniref:Glycerophosphoryl diester phosphodiesterase n=1 Tax=Paenibacillus polysaccharolyticus TaxID=582692 RepID=A0A1G5KQP2_9BACL|nr:MULTISPECIES: glycerophosphodiester phosphodiesterase [Paenibacillus]SCZ02511.1 glycerophosphoryl diester phosphodiesterase [Paenibacillus polysaccharolyticus]